MKLTACFVFASLAVTSTFVQSGQALDLKDIGKIAESLDIPFVDHILDAFDSKFKDRKVIKCATKDYNYDKDKDYHYGKDKDYDYGKDKDYDYGKDKDYDYGKDKDYDYGKDKDYDYGKDKDYDYGKHNDYVKKKTHFLVNLDKKGNALLRWVPVDVVEMIIDPKEGIVKLKGDLVPEDKKYSEYVLTIDFTYYGEVDFKKCYCASEGFAGDVKHPNYEKIEKQCTLKNYWKRPEKAKDLLFCPTCRDYQCQLADKKRDYNGAPKPIYKDWNFYKHVKGSLSGPGLKLFREKVVEGFEHYGLEKYEKCTPDISYLPLSQLHCSDYSKPRKGYGYGVNGKDQDCGFSSWFNCKEDIKKIGGDYKKLRVADINLDIIDCKFPHKPRPKPSCPKLKPCKEVKVCIPCEYKDKDCKYPDDGWW